MRLDALRNRIAPYLDLLRDTWRSDRRGSTLLAAIVLVRSVSPFVFAVGAAVVVSKVPATVRRGLGSPSGHRLLIGLAVMGLAFAVQQISPAVQLTVGDALSRRYNAHVDRKLMRLALAPRGIAHLEDPSVGAQLAAARRAVAGWPRPGDAVVSLGGRVALYVSLWAGSLLLLPFHIWAAIALLVSAALLQRRVAVAMAAIGESQAGRAMALRETTYLRDLALEIPAAKEIRVFGLGQWLVGRHLRAWRAARDAMRSSQQRGYRAMAQATLLTTIVVIAIVGVLSWQVSTGGVALAVVALTLQGVALVTRSIGDEQAVRDGMVLGYAMAATGATRELEERIRTLAFPVAGARPAAGLPGTGITFAGVRFAYPGSEHEILHGLDLVVPAGESLGIVGLNGAGKTTLIKLLCRFYDPTDGAITVDGIDLRELAPESWPPPVAAIFQDYVHFPLSASDNVALVDRDAATLERAASVAGLHHIVDALPSGWDTILAPNRPDGVDLSGGQWQRVALARALYAAGRGAKVLVLDEPTANLDIRGEAEIYDQFLEMTSGLTTVLISHRLSSVRRTHRIAVIDDGVVAEIGPHDELIARGGRYAELFRLQAAAFADEAAT